MSGDLYVDIGGLRSGGAALSAAGDDMGNQLKSALERVRALSDADPAGDDATGRSFHQNYDESSHAILDNGPKIPAGLSALGVFAQNAANEYAALDNTSAANVQGVTGDFHVPGIDGGAGATDSSSGGRH